MYQESAWEGTAVKVAIVTDATASLPPALTRELGILVVPVPIQVGRETFLGGVDPPERFYDLLARGELPGTSTPSPGMFMDIYRSLEGQAAAIVSVHVAASKSAVQQSARIAASMLPHLEIHVVDSGQVSLGLGLLAAGAARMAREGQTAAEIVRWLAATVPRTEVVAAVRDLAILRRSGRVGMGKSLVAGLLNIKPVLQVHAGEIQVVDQVRAWPRAVERLVELARAAAANRPGRLHLAVVHTHCPADAAALQEMLAPSFPDAEILVAEAGPALASHAGPGTLGICVLSDPVD